MGLNTANTHKLTHYPGGRFFFLIVSTFSSLINMNLMWRQWLNISCLELRLAKFGLSTMLNFSLRHNLQVLATGLYVGTFLSRYFQVTTGLLPAFFSFQKCVVMQVWPSANSSSRHALCLPYRFLKFLANPTYVSTPPLFVVTVVWYTAPSWLHSPGIGQSFFKAFWQLQCAGGLGWVVAVLLKIFELCLATMLPILGKHL